MPRYHCLIPKCFAATPRYAIRKFMLKHYLWRHTRTELIELARQHGISNNPFFETTWILAYQLTDKSEVMLN